MEKFSGWGRGGGGETIEDPNEEEKIGDGINGGKPLEDNGNGEVIGTVVGETLGEAIKSNAFEMKMNRFLLLLHTWWP